MSHDEFIIWFNSEYTFTHIDRQAVIDHDLKNIDNTNADETTKQTARLALKNTLIQKAQAWNRNFWWNPFAAIGEGINQLIGLPKKILGGAGIPTPKDVTDDIQKLINNILGFLKLAIIPLAVVAVIFIIYMMKNK